MIEVPVYNQQGEKTGSLSVDEARLGGTVRTQLLKQAALSYHNATRQGTVATKSRGMVEGSTRKLYAQKHTGRARMGPVRTPLRRGGGHAFAKVPRDFSQKLSKKSRRLARNSALLAKLLSQEVVVLESLKLQSPKTKPFAQLLAKLGIDRSCMLALDAADMNVYLSARNVDRMSVCQAEQLNAFHLLQNRKLLITREGLQRLVDQDKEAN
ncbi:MAG: 50S ribosomal protein L4 [Phycisphaerae bacterium]|nr:50S ribosomal protein L4 [Phycisphaerae bacterium]